MGFMKLNALQKSILKLVALLILVGPAISTLSSQAFASSMPTGSTGDGR
jgi:hypothetical protein